MATLTPEEIAALKAQRVALVKAMRSGALSVQHGDKRVQYRSIEEIRAVLQGIDDELATGEGTPRRKVIYSSPRRGY
jgi:hypothetical protein